MQTESTGIALHLNYLRSAFLVGMALAVKYPTDQEWEEALQRHDIQQHLDKFVAFLSEIRAEHSGELTPELAQKVGEAHTETANTFLVDLAEEWDIPASDLLTVFINS